MNKKHPIIFICGLGGTGKSTLSTKLSNLLSRECNILSLDWYLIHSTNDRKEDIKKALESRDQELIEQRENPVNWNDYDKLKKDLVYLQEHSHLEVRDAWNQKSGEKDLEINIQFENKDGIIICEGICLLHPQISSLADLIICLEVSEEETVKRTNQRDLHRSSPEYLAYKAKLQEKYDIPYFKNNVNAADLVINMEEKQEEEIAEIIKNKLNL